ncbi:MAG: Hpt domain-containing protein, partial [Thermoguttaceae bacterium]|nr:Hpt domain-containing protein [Thermoguttaceae bacterium]
EPIHADVRTLHSIKGTAACLGLDAYKLFAHGLENVLAQLRDGKTFFSEPLWEILIEGIDHLEWMLRSAADGAILQELGPAKPAILARLRLPSSLPSQMPGETPAESIEAILDEMFGASASPASQPSATLTTPQPTESAEGPSVATSNLLLRHCPKKAPNRNLPGQKILLFMSARPTPSDMSGSKKLTWRNF